MERLLIVSGSVRCSAVGQLQASGLGLSRISVWVFRSCCILASL